MNITHYFLFTDEAAAKAALPSYWMTTDDGWSWDMSRVDAPVSVVQADGVTPDPGYHLNLGLPALSAALVATSSFIGALDEQRNLVAGSHPTSPQRVFA